MKRHLTLTALAAITLLSSCSHPIPVSAQTPAALMPVPKMQFFSATGSPLPGGTLGSYLAGTSTPSPTYTDSTGTTPNSNPIILDSAGRAGIWLGARAYKIVLRSPASPPDTSCSTGAVQWTEDNVADEALLLKLTLAISITTGTLTADKVHITGTGSWCGNSSTSSAGVILNCDNTFTNPDQSAPVEARGISVVNRRVQTIYPEGGADQFGVVGAITIEPATTTGTIIGQMKSLVGETYLSHPTVGAYTVNNAFGLQLNIPVLGTNATLANYYGILSNAPCRHSGDGCYGGDASFSGGTIGNAYHFYAEGMPPGVVTGTRAAFKAPAYEDAGRLMWNNQDLRESLDANAFRSVVVANGPLQLGRAPISASGLVNVSGQSVTYSSGANQFTIGTTWNGQTIQIAGINYVIESVTDATHLKLVYPGAGTQSGASYLVLVPVDVSFLSIAYQNSAQTTIPHVGRIYPKESDGLLYYKSANGTEYNLTSGSGGGCSPACWFVATSAATGNSPAATAFLGTADNNHLAMVTNGAEIARWEKTGRLLSGMTSSDLSASTAGNILASGSVGVATANVSASYAALSITTNGTALLSSSHTASGINLPLQLASAGTVGISLLNSSAPLFHRRTDWLGISAPAVSCAVTSATVDTVGTAVHATSGTFATTGCVGQPITINSVSYYIASVTDSTNLVLLTSAGSQSSVSATITDTGAIYYDSSSHLLKFSVNGGAYASVGTGGTSGWAIGGSAGGVDTVGANKYIGIADNFDFIQTTNSTDRGRWLKGGGLTIGATSGFGGATALTVDQAGFTYGLVVNQSSSGSGSLSVAKSGTLNGAFSTDGSLVTLQSLGSFPLLLGTNSTEAMRITSTQQVFFGSTSVGSQSAPYYMKATGSPVFEINTTNSGGNMYFEANSGTVYGTAAFSNSAFTLASAGASVPLILKSNNTTALTLQASTQIATFAVAGEWTGVATGAVGVSGASTGRLIYDSSLQHFYISENGGAYALLSSGGSSGWPIGTGAGSGNYGNGSTGPFYLGLQNPGSLAFTTNSVEAARFDGSQRLIVGSSTGLTTGGVHRETIKSSDYGQLGLLQNAGGTSRLTLASTIAAVDTAGGELAFDTNNFLINTAGSAGASLILGTGASRTAALTFNTAQTATFTGTTSSSFNIDTTGHPLITLKASGTSIGTVGDRGTSGNLSVHSVGGADISLFNGVATVSISHGGGSTTFNSNGPISIPSLNLSSASTVLGDGSMFWCADCKNSSQDTFTPGAACVGFATGHGNMAILRSTTYYCTL